MVIARILLLCCLLPACALAADARSKFREIWQDEWEWRLQQMPLFATSVGVHTYDDRLGDVRPAVQQQRLEHWRKVLQDLDRVKPDDLDGSAQVDYAIYRAQIESFIANIELGSPEMPMNSDSAFWSDLAMLPRVQPMRGAVDARRYIARLRAVPEYFAQHIELLQAGLASGRTLPRVILEGRDQPIAELAKLTDPTASSYYEPMQRLPSSIAPALAEQLRKEARAAIREAVIPAHATLLKFMREHYLPGARKSLAAQELPNGRAWYRQQIIDYVTEDLSPGQIHQIGLIEVARIRQAMQQIIDELKFKGDFAAFLAFLRSDPQFYAKTPDELLAQAAWVAKRADGALPRFFGKLPRLPYGVQAVPDAIAPFYTGGRYVPPAEGSQEPGWYWVNTHDLKSRPLYTLPALTLHEAAPGHHLQGALAMEQGGQLPFRRYSYISAYGEGWALYTEELGIEMGIYRTPYERFGQLTYAMWRACRLVVDTGIHAKGWTREQAVAYMLANTALSAHEIRTEVDRYISWPGQALSYMIGMIRIRELRREAEAALGPGFDLRAFHDTVLETGSVPLPILSQHVRRWIEMQRAR
ncbi:MAG: DUF885 domain-containing protein [Rhodanobacteraceae bacterium]|nr:DUF885 domain-containing protein [Rhodanobacteraceae bacterium]